MRISASTSAPLLPKLSLLSGEQGGRGEVSKGDTSHTPRAQGGTVAPRHFSVPSPSSSQWGRAVRRDHQTPRIAEDVSSEDGGAGAGTGAGSESVGATDTSCSGSEFSYSEVMYPKAAVKTLDGFLLSPRDHMEVEKKRKLSKVCALVSCLRSHCMLTFPMCVCIYIYIYCVCVCVCVCV